MAPSVRYTNIASPPRRLPSAAPVSKTAKVCKVIGTGVMGIWNDTCAHKPVNMLKPTTNKTSRSKLILREVREGTRYSTRVELGEIAIKAPSILSMINIFQYYVLTIHSI